MRIANHLGAALAALCIVGLSGAPAMAETSDVTVAAATDSDVPDLQETAEDPTDVDPTPGVDVLPDDAPSALAAPTPGCRFGAKSSKWTAVKKPWAVTHAKGYENLSGATATYTRQASWQRTLEASASWTGEGGASANVLIAQLEGKTGMTLAMKGQRTDGTTESVTATMSPNRVFIFYAGARNTTGTLTHYVCNSINFAEVGHGKVKSFGQKREGAVRFGSTVGKSTLGYRAARENC